MVVNFMAVVVALGGREVGSLIGGQIGQTGRHGGVGVQRRLVVVLPELYNARLQGPPLEDVWIDGRHKVVGDVSLHGDDEHNVAIHLMQNVTDGVAVASRWLVQLNLVMAVPLPNLEPS